MIFAFPYALGGLLAALGLVAVYTLRARFRRRPVSSLMLWRQTQRPSEGGVHRDRLRLPPLFYLEMAAICALIAAALTPHLRSVWHGSLIVVCDTSASMGARDETGRTPHERGVQALQGALRRTHYGRVRLLLAGRQGPEVLAPLSPSQAANRLAATACPDPGDSLDATLARAGELAGEIDDILVLADRAPAADTTLRPGVKWLALGTPLPNRALTLAERTWQGGGQEELLLEVEDFGSGQTEIPLQVTPLTEGTPLHAAPLALDAQGRGRLRLTLPAATPALQIELPADALAIDNSAILLPTIPMPIKVDVRLADEALRQVVTRAVLASGRAEIDANSAQLRFTAPPVGRLTTDAPWHCLIAPPLDGRLMRLPWLADTTHYLLEGVSYAGLAMTVGTNALPGRGLVYAGNQPLLSFETAPRQPPILHLQSAGAHEALFRSAAWPALVYNLIEACANARPGPPRPNLRGGEVTTFATTRGGGDVRFTTPAGTAQLRAQEGRLEWAPTLPGLYEMHLKEGGSVPFAVNFTAPAESDLRQAQSGTWHQARDIEGLQRTHRPITWMVGLAALLLLALHHALVGRPRMPMAGPSPAGTKL